MTINNREPHKQSALRQNNNNLSTAKRLQISNGCQQWLLIYLVWLISLLSCLQQASAVAESAVAGTNQEVCNVKQECQLCTAGDIETVPECKKTGKIETYTCVTLEDGAQVDSRHKVESCQRTRADEEYLMVQLQIICLLVGSFTYMTVKRQRQLYASGFDQRKEFPGGASTSHRSMVSSPNTVASNFSSGLDRVSTADERVPLANDDESGIEVV